MAGPRGEHLLTSGRSRTRPLITARSSLAPTVRRRSCGITRRNPGAIPHDDGVRLITARSGPWGPPTRLPFVRLASGIPAVQAAADVLTDALLSHLSYEEQQILEPLARLGSAIYG